MNTCSSITNKFLQKSERGEAGKPRSRIFFFHYAELMSTLDLLSAYPESFMWSAFHMVGKSPPASGTFLSILSSHPTHQYHLGSQGHSASLTSIKDSNISIGTNTKNYTATWPRTMQQGYTCWCRNKPMGIPLTNLFRSSHQTFTDFNSFSEESPWSTSDK